MGYDMYIENGPDEAERAAVEEAGQRLERARTSGTGLREAYQALTVANHSYYRLNIWGMGTARDLMGAFGMLTFEEPPEFPASESEGYTEAADALRGAPDDEAARTALDSIAARLRAAEEAACTADPGGPGIPYYKLTSNDGWLVTPREIAAALKAYESTSTTDREDAGLAFEPWPSWIQYLTEARHRGGFRVH